jgi:hypothetical protein
VPRFVIPALLALASTLSAQTLFPLKDVRPGMRGVGRTVFAGDRVEEFQVEVLGVLDNVGPKQALILARLSGGPLDHTGVMQGMSGSPVYFDGKLAGAVAMAFPYSKDPIAGIRPIEEMVSRTGPAQAAPTAAAFGEHDLLRAFSRPQPVAAAEGRMLDIATPVSFGGFSARTVEVFGAQLRSLGLEPRQAIAAGSSGSMKMGNPADLKPGSMISVQLMNGDLSVGADGTVTHIDGSRIYAFGHRFLAVGPTAIPFARAEVIALLPALNTSYKLSVAKEWMGSIQQDRDVAISGELGKLPVMAPVTVAVTRAGRPVETYRMEMIDDPLISPLLLQMAVFSAMDATERSQGPGSVRVTGQVEFAGGPMPLTIDNIYAASSDAATQASAAIAVPPAYIMQSTLRTLSLKRADLHVDFLDQKKELAIDSLSVGRRTVRAGDTVRLNIALAGENGAEVARQVDYRVPLGTDPGTLFFTVADAGATNLADFRQIIGATPRSPSQLIAMVNALHPNYKAYVRVWRAAPSFQLEGVDLPDPPASMALLLAGSQQNVAGMIQTRNSKIAEIEIDAGGAQITGSKTIQVEIKE